MRKSPLSASILPEASDPHVDNLLSKDLKLETGVERRNILFQSKYQRHPFSSSFFEILCVETQIWLVLCIRLTNCKILLLHHLILYSTYLIVIDFRIYSSFTLSGYILPSFCQQKWISSSLQALKSEVFVPPLQTPAMKFSK